jgi:hypothetical protein
MEIVRLLGTSLPLGFIQNDTGGNRYIQGIQLTGLWNKYDVIHESQ